MPRPLKIVESKPSSLEPQLSLKCDECPTLSTDIESFFVVQPDGGAVRVARYEQRLMEADGSVACSVGCAQKAVTRMIAEMG